MKKNINFATVKRVQTFRRHWRYPVVEEVAHSETAGFPLLRPFPKGTACPIQGQKSRLTKGRHVLNVPVKSLEMGFSDLLPACEPKLYYTDTSFDTIRSG